MGRHLLHQKPEPAQSASHHLDLLQIVSLLKTQHEPQPASRTRRSSGYHRGHSHTQSRAACARLVFFQSLFLTHSKTSRRLQELLSHKVGLHRLWQGHVCCSAPALSSARTPHRSPRSRPAHAQLRQTHCRAFSWLQAEEEQTCPCPPS